MTGPSLTYLIESLPWAVAGFLAGCLATLKIRPAIAPQEGPVTSTDPPKPRRKVTVVHVLGLVVVALTVVSAIQGWAQSRATERLTQCLVTYANATADAIDIRSKAGAEAAWAAVQMWRTVFQQSMTEEGRAAARRVFEEYLTKQEQALNTQRANPYPLAPRDVCPADGGA